MIDRCTALTLQAIVLFGLAGCNSTGGKPADKGQRPALSYRIAPAGAVHCGKDAAPPPYPDKPYGIHPGEVPFNLKFSDEQGPASLGRFYEPCAPRPRLIVLRLLAAWCGPCQWYAAHTGELLHDKDLAGRVVVVDDLLYDAYNVTATAAAIPAFARYYDAPAHILAADMAQFHANYLGFGPNDNTRLPLIVLLDSRTMRVLDRLSAPDPDSVVGAARKALARLDGRPEPAVTPPALFDGRFTRERWEMIRQMALPTPLVPPPDPTNRVADNPDAAALGRALMDDLSLGGAGAVGCVTCHRKETFRSDNLPTSLGVDPTGKSVAGDRNAPWLGTAAFDRLAFWDGRADSLWAQALMPLESKNEISSNRLRVVRAALSRYGDLYAKVFGAHPSLADLSDPARFPADAMPGMPAWEGMAAADRTLVNRVYSNLGKSIAAFERRIKPAPVAIDRYATGDLSALTPDEKDGLLRYFEVGCAQCHYGPMFTDGSFHSTYFPTGRRDGKPDRGFVEGIPQLLANEFRGDSPYSDAPAVATWLGQLRATEETIGHFKTFGLRGIADTAPYGHGGAVPTLQALIDLYADGGLPDGDPRTTGYRDIAMVRFDKKDPRNQSLIHFLQTFKGTLVE